MERTTSATVTHSDSFTHGAYKVSLIVAGNLVNLSDQAASGLVDQAVASIKGNVVPAIADAVSSQDSSRVRGSIVPVVETVEVSLHGTKATLVVTVEPRVAIAIQHLNLQDVVQTYVTGPVSRQIVDVITGADNVLEIEIEIDLSGVSGVPNVIGSSGSLFVGNLSDKGDSLSDLLDSFQANASRSGRMNLGLSSMSGTSRTPFGPSHNQPKR